MERFGPNSRGWKVWKDRPVRMLHQSAGKYNSVCVRIAQQNQRPILAKTFYSTIAFSDSRKVDVVRLSLRLF